MNIKRIKVPATLPFWISNGFLNDGPHLSIDNARQRLTSLMPNGANHRKEFDHCWIVDTNGTAVNVDGSVEREEIFPEESPASVEPVAQATPEPKPNPILIEVRANYWIERFDFHNAVHTTVWESGNAVRKNYNGSEKACELADADLARFDKRFPA